MEFNTKAFLRHFAVTVPKRGPVPPAPLPRPYGTRYYKDAHDAQAAWSSCGAAKTEAGAVRAAVLRLFTHQCAKALIFDRRTGAVLRWLHPSPEGLRVEDVTRR